MDDVVNVDNPNEIITASSRNITFSGSDNLDESNRPFSPRVNVTPIVMSIKLQRPQSPDILKDPESIERPQSSTSQIDPDSNTSTSQTQPTRKSRNRIRIPKRDPNTVEDDAEDEDDKTEEVKTTYGTFTIPKYDLWTQEERDRERNTLTTKLGTIKNTYGDYGLPIADEETASRMTLRNLKIHFEQIIKHIKARRGATQWKSFLLLFWMCIEGGCTALGMNASGYTLSQWRSYEVYERYLIEMGEMQSFGDGWPPYIMILFLSGVHALIFILANYVLGNTGISSSLSNFAIGKLGGGGNQEVDENGIPIEVNIIDDPVGTLLSNIGVGGVINTIRGETGNQNNQSNQSNRNNRGTRRATNKRGGRNLFPNG